MDVRSALKTGLAIPAHPLALTSERKLDERHQRALTRYYLASAVGGLAIGVHTTQFAIRDPQFALLQPVLELAMEEMRPHPIVKIAGVCGPLQQAIQEAELASKLGYDAALLSLAALKNATISELIAHAQAIASVIPVIGFYLQPAVGGRPLPLEFWAQFAEIQNVVAIKIAPFNRYQTLDVVRGVIAAGRANQIPLYTGNDDNILFDLLSEFNFAGQRLRIVGGLLGHWAVWASVAVSHLKRIRQIVNTNQNIPPDLLTLAWQVTDANAALFDAANGFHGCIAGIHEVLRRQGLLAGRWLLDPKEDLSPGQSQEIDRICTLYPHLQDNHFIEANLAAWLS